MTCDWDQRRQESSEAVRDPKILQEHILEFPPDVLTA